MQPHFEYFVLLTATVLAVTSVEGFPRAPSPTPAKPGCFLLTNGNRYLDYSTFVNANNNLHLAVLLPNRTESAVWKVIPIAEPSFRLCNAQTGRFLMVDDEDLTYVAGRKQMAAFPPESFMFAPYFRDYPKDWEELITSQLKSYQLCINPAAEYNSDPLIIASPNRTTFTEYFDCNWNFQSVKCPRPNLC